MTHLLNLLGKMCKYELDPASIVKDTKWTRFCPQTDGRMNKVRPVKPPFNFVEAGMIKINKYIYVWILHIKGTVLNRSLQRLQPSKLYFSNTLPKIAAFFAKS